MVSGCMYCQDKISYKSINEQLTAMMSPKRTGYYCIRTNSFISWDKPTAIT